MSEIPDFPGVAYENETDHTPGAVPTSPEVIETPPAIDPIKEEAIRLVIARNPNMTTAELIHAASEVEAYLRGGTEGTIVLPEAGSEAPAASDEAPEQG